GAPDTGRVPSGPPLAPTLTTPPDAALVTSHLVLLEGLPACTAQYYSVVSSDGLGNQSVADNGGSFFTFATDAERTPSFTSPDPPLAIPVGPYHGALATISV